MSVIQNRYDFVYLFDVSNGNSNGDPDAGNLPRLDPETNEGLVTDVCLKRKVRNFVEMAKSGQSRFGIYVQEGAILNEMYRKAYIKVRENQEDTAKAKKLSPKTDEEAAILRQFMCDNFFDVRCCHFDGNQLWPSKRTCPVCFCTLDRANTSTGNFDYTNDGNQRERKKT